MTERLLATSVTNPDVHTELVVANRTPVGGGFENKWQLEASVAGRDISLLERTYDRGYIDAWIGFRAAGMPVVPTLRTNAETSLLVTDVKANGGEAYGKALQLITSGALDEQRTRPRQQIDEIFMDLTGINNFPAIEEEAQRLLDRANASNLRLPYDDPFELVVNPNGTWKLMTLDLRFAKVQDAVRGNPILLEEAKRLNALHVDDFLMALRSLHEYFSKQNQAQSRFSIGRLLGWVSSKRPE